MGQLLFHDFDIIVDVNPRIEGPRFSEIQLLHHESDNIYGRERDLIRDEHIGKK